MIISAFVLGYVLLSGYHKKLLGKVFVCLIDLSKISYKGIPVKRNSLVFIII